LVPLCANCDVMAHRKKDSVTSVDALKALIEKAAGQDPRDRDACNFSSIREPPPADPQARLLGSVQYFSSAFGRLASFCLQARKRPTVPTPQSVVESVAIRGVSLYPRPQELFRIMLRKVIL
jgi:hypothetical protein